MMRAPFFIRLLVTVVAVVAACGAGYGLWQHYLEAPWTRDGRVAADVITVTPDVSGLVADVLVRDNQEVTKGDVLFRVDPVRFKLALQQAEAVLASRLASLQEAQREAARYAALPNIAVSQEKQQQTQTSEQTAQAAYGQAMADRDVAALNLVRTEVRASANGQVTNFDLRPGDYVSAGRGVFALIDTDTLRVEGYFEETKLEQIRPGDAARVRLIGGRAWMPGHVESIAGGITNQDVGQGGNLLASVNPTFSWVRLAQRIPVRVLLDSAADRARLVVGRTATVEVVGR